MHLQVQHPHSGNVALCCGLHHGTINASTLVVHLEQIYVALPAVIDLGNGKPPPGKSLNRN